MAGFSKFDGVSGQVHQTLLQSHRIGTDSLGQITAQENVKC
jgi:hypothetical protein